MSRYKIPPLIPEALYEFRTKPMKDTQGAMLPDGFVTMITQFVREEGSKYVFITKRLTIGGTEVMNNANDTTEIEYEKAGISETFFVFEYRPTGGKRKSQKRLHKKSKSKKSRKNKK
jgi:predicted acetyltransferase